MGKFKRFNRFEGRDSDRSVGRFSGRASRPGKRFGEEDSGRLGGGYRERSQGRQRESGLEMFDATCGKCGRRCEVPFKPMRGKPVYCSDCFRKKDYPDSRDAPSRGRSSEFRVKEEFSSEALEQINHKLDKIMKVLKIQ